MSARGGPKVGRWSIGSKLSGSLAAEPDQLHMLTDMDTSHQALASVDTEGGDQDSSGAYNSVTSFSGGTSLGVLR